MTNTEIDDKYVIVLIWPLIFVHNVHVSTLPKEKLNHLDVILTDSQGQRCESILKVELQFVLRYRIAQCYLSGWVRKVTLFCASMSASCSSSKTAVEMEGMFAAKWRAVLSSTSTRLGSAWFSSSILTQRSCWHCTAWHWKEIRWVLVKQLLRSLNKSLSRIIL